MKKSKTNRLQIFLRENNIKQKEIAALLNCTAPNVSYICSNKRTLSFSDAELIGQKYGVRAKWLLGEDDFKTDADARAFEALSITQKLYKADAFFKAVEDCFNCSFVIAAGEAYLHSDDCYLGKCSETDLLYLKRAILDYAEFQIKKLIDE